MASLVLPAVASAHPDSGDANAADRTELDYDDLELDQLLPVPEASRGPAIGSSGYYSAPIRDGLHWITDGTYQSLFLETRTGVVLIDAPSNLGERILTAVRAVTDKPITHVVYSHPDSDHIGAAGLVPGPVTVIAHSETARELAEGTSANETAPIPAPTVTFYDLYHLRVGGESIRLKFPDDPHEDGSVFIHLPRQRTLMVVDVILPGWAPFRGLATESVPNWLATHDEILGYDFETFVGGHVSRLGSRQDAVIGREFAHSLRSITTEALQRVDFRAVAAEVIGQVGPELPYAITTEYLDRVAQECSVELVQIWGSRLGGVDVYAHENCLTMARSLGADAYPPLEDE